MDSTTKNPRVVAIHLSRIERHLAEAFREANRIDPVAFDADIITDLRKALASVWATTQDVQARPVIITEKPKKAKAQKVAKDLVVFAPVLAAAEAATADEVEAEEDDLAPGPYDHIQEQFDNA